MGFGYPSKRHGLFPGLEEFGQELCVESIINTNNRIGQWSRGRLKLTRIKLSMVNNVYLLPFLLGCAQQEDLCAGPVIFDGFKTRVDKPESFNHFYTLFAGLLASEMEITSQEAMLSKFVATALGFQDIFRLRRGLT